MKIGFEIHVQLKTQSKLFCSCSTRFLDAAPNTNICPVCTGQPGSKPAGINVEALRKAVLVALALNCKVKEGEVRFLRKHYFYPDLPNNYQRTSEPIAENGQLAGVRIREIHVEEDPGRYELREGTVDYNRSGVPLIEIVTEPDMHSVDEAREFLKQLKAVLDYLDVPLYPEIAFRVDANISLEGGERVEIKNINSIHGVVKALMYEISRQKKLLSAGKKVARETRHWDERRGVTVTLREKETAEDYRYFPDPDIPPFSIPKEMIEEALRTMPELPHQREKRLIETYDIPESAAHTFVLDRLLADLFEDLAKRYSARFALTFCSALRGELNYRGKYLEEIAGRERLYTLAELYATGKITKPVFVEQMRRVLDDPTFTPTAVGVLEKEELERIVIKVIEGNKRAVEDYKAGRKEALNFLVGMVLKEVKGKADPKQVRELLLRKIVG